MKAKQLMALLVMVMVIGAYAVFGSTTLAVRWIDRQLTGTACASGAPAQVLVS